MIPGKCLLLFDFDGVLADSAQKTMAVSYTVARQFGATIPMTRELLSSLSDMSIAGGGRAMGVPEDQLIYFEAALSETYQELSHDYEPFDGMADVVRILGAEHFIGIVTNNTERLVKKFIKQNRLDRIVTLILGMESGGEKSVRIRRAAEQSAVDLDRTFMIGDSRSDITEARLAGCHALAVCWGFQGREFLEAASPDYLISSPSELIEIFSSKPQRVATP